MSVETCYGLLPATHTLLFDFSHGEGAFRVLPELCRADGIEKVHDPRQDCVASVVICNRGLLRRGSLQLPPATS